MRSLAPAVLAAVLAAPFATRAVDLADGKLSLNGNGAWAFEKTDHNLYFKGDPDGEWSTAMFDLLVSARPSPDVVLQAQLGFEPGGEGEPSGASLEWAFAEWRFSDLLRARAGKVKQPFGNYAELQFVGTARPFYTLPENVYGTGNVAASAYSGVGLTGEWLHASGFGVQYDAYGGALDFTGFEPWQVITTSGLFEEETVENLVGGRVSLLTPWEWTLRLSGMGGNVQKDDGDTEFLVYGASIFHRGERLWASVEAFQSSEGSREEQTAVYAELAYFLTEHLQAAGRWERQWTRLESKPAVDGIDRFLRHEEVAGGLNWWFTPQLVAKLSVHQTWGWRFVIPETLGTGEPLPRSNATLTVFAGTQFTF